MTHRERILVSECLLGRPCRYDGKAWACENVRRLAEAYELVPVCPEVKGGLPTPRTPSEIQPDGRVLDQEGVDRTAAFIAGAEAAVALAYERGCARAILKSRSPSCGVSQVYDGTFSGVVIPGQGLTAAALRDTGVELADETDFEQRFGITAPAHPRCIVITGGPCAGKTSAMDALREQLSRGGTRAIFVPEAATDLINSGIAPWTCSSMLDFQTQVIALQLERETAAREEAQAMGPDAIIICDRGICDSNAYLSDEDFARALTANGLDELAALARYDAIFHLESVAKADTDAYTQANNSARFENAEEAIEADDRVIAAWLKHPHTHFISNETTFDQKARKLATAIEAFLSEA